MKPIIERVDITADLDHPDTFELRIDLICDSAFAQRVSDWIRSQCEGEPDEDLLGLPAGPPELTEGDVLELPGEGFVIDGEFDEEPD